MILEGRTLAAQIRAPLADRANAVREKLGRPIMLAAIGSTEDYGAYVYLKKEVQAAQSLGVQTQVFEINNHTSAADFLALVRRVAEDPQVDAILIPRPLPAHLADCGFARLLPPGKDIDGMSNISMGNLFLCKTAEELALLDTFVPCTALAVLRLLDFHGLNPQGLETVVIGRSSTVGRPLAHMLTCRNATVKICHTKTADLKASLSQAQLVCSAVGKARFLTADMVRPEATVIDIATNIDSSGALCGDADSEAMLARGTSVSPVPGGVGPVTLACLLENIILSGEKKLQENV